ncbi:unannotated protein [freshwater metagenome]|uniref:Unannotated protein n=1 Tax=freshwater metagenome TaxID=449393 RepID=A0A6J6TT99_9ZZZZ
MLDAVEAQFGDEVVQGCQADGIPAESIQCHRSDGMLDARDTCPGCCDSPHHHPEVIRLVLMAAEAADCPLEIRFDGDKQVLHSLRVITLILNPQEARAHGRLHMPMEHVDERPLALPLDFLRAGQGPAQLPVRHFELGLDLRGQAPCCRGECDDEADEETERGHEEHISEGGRGAPCPGVGRQAHDLAADEQTAGEHRPPQRLTHSGCSHTPCMARKPEGAPACRDSGGVEAEGEREPVSREHRRERGDDESHDDDTRSNLTGVGRRGCGALPVDPQIAHRNIRGLPLGHLGVQVVAERSNDIVDRCPKDAEGDFGICVRDGSYCFDEVGLDGRHECLVDVPELCRSLHL